MDDDTYRRARIAAAACDRSVSALVRDFLRSLGTEENETTRLKREERALRDRIGAFTGSDRLPRNEVYSRGS